MKRARIRQILQLSFSALFLCLLTVAAVSQRSEVINNDRIIELVALGIGDPVLIPKINSSKIVIDASEAGLLKLKSAGVSDAVVLALMHRAAINGYIMNGGDINRIELPSGTEINITTVEKISGRKVTEGQVLTFKTAGAVVIGGKTVIAKDTPVLAVVSKARKPGMTGRGGELSVVLQSTLSVDGQTVKLRAAKSGRGGDNFGTAYTLSYIMGIGLLIPGKNAEIKAGTTFAALTEESRFIAASR